MQGSPVTGKAIVRCGGKPHGTEPQSAEPRAELTCNNLMADMSARSLLLVIPSRLGRLQQGRQTPACLSGQAADAAWLTMLLAWP